MHPLPSRDIWNRHRGGCTVFLHPLSVRHILHHSRGVSRRDLCPLFPRDIPDWYGRACLVRVHRVRCGNILGNRSSHHVLDMCVVFHWDFLDFCWRPVVLRVHRLPRVQLGLLQERVWPCQRRELPGIAYQHEAILPVRHAFGGLPVWARRQRAVRKHALCLRLGHGLQRDHHREWADHPARHADLDSLDERVV